MRLVARVLLLGVVVVLPCAAQQAPAGSAPGSQGQKRVHRVLAPPKAATVQGKAASSTAETMAAHVDEPLKQMPALAVTDGSGKAADLGSLHSAKGHWLLLYRPERCAPCDTVMAALAKSESPLFKQGASLVVVVKRNAPATGSLDKLKSAYPTLSNATWVEDTNGAAFAALKPHGEPVLYAVSDSDIGWAMHGAAGNPAMVERLASSWLASTSKPRVAAAPASASSTAAKSGAAAIRTAPVAVKSPSTP